MNLLSQPNADGGWAYTRGCSWAEPTVLALLAHHAVGIRNSNYEAGLKFLHSLAAPDGGYRPHVAVSESTWVTAAATLLPENDLGKRQYRRAIEWLKGQTGRESGWRYRLERRLTGNTERNPEAWPWFPGAAAWVIPTAFGIFAFEKARAQEPDPELDGRILTAQEFLLARMCADGGWNHGSNRALGKDGDSYPETTGLGLLALASAPRSPQLERAKTAAARHLAANPGAEGRAWLTLGLAAHGVRVAVPSTLAVHTVVEEALTSIAAAPRNPFRPS